MANAPPGRWRAVELVAKGAAGTVSRALDADGRPVALKHYSDVALGLREAALLRRAERRYGPRCLGVAREEGGLVVALEWVEGTPLGRALSDQLSVAERQRLATVVAHGVARGLAELHEAGIRHGDVKPDNILLHEQTGATLIDLSLAVDVAAALAGGTRAYLAPEVVADPHRAGPETDLYALGRVLLGVLGDDRHGSPIGALADALVAPAPGGRPSATFVATRAAQLLGLEADPVDAAQARQATVRRAYLRARERELALATRVDESLEGTTRGWLLAVLGAEVHDGVAAEGATIGPIDALARARWLTALFGAPPPAGPWNEAPEAELAAQLLQLAEQRTAFVYADLERGDVPSDLRIPDTLVELAVALAVPRPSARVLATAEAQLATAPDAFAVALAEALLRAGEIGRAWLVVAAREAPGARALSADLARRRGDPDRARALAEAALTSDDHVARARAAAVLGRLSWERGDYDAAERAVADVGGAAPAEVRALVAYARGDFAGGLATVERALAGGADLMARTRLEGVRGMLEHGRGNAVASVRAFATAADHAAQGSVLDEASYLTGLGAAAADAGEIDRALVASTRAALLWERLGQPDNAARAWQSRAVALALVGAEHEARAAADEVIHRAEARGDVLAAAYARMVHVETRPRGDALARTLALATARVLVDAPFDARARADARVLVWAEGSLSRVQIAAIDEQVNNASAATRYEWWGARARGLSATGNAASGRAVLAELVRLLVVDAPIASRAPAIHAGLALARALGDGEAARRFEVARRSITETLRAHVPAEYESRLAATASVESAADGAASALDPAQIAQLEAIVRGLGGQDRLSVLLNQVLDALLLWTGVERGLLLLRAPDGGLVARAGRNLARGDLEGDQRALSLGIARRALEERDVVVATDAFASLGELHASVHALRLRSVLAVPLIARGETLGVVYLDDRRRRGAFGAAEVAWVRLLSTHAALAVADARDAVRLRRALRHAERARARAVHDLEVRSLELDRAKAALGSVEHVRYRGLAGRSEAMQRTLHVVARVAGSAVPVLLVGESGTGKELLARAVHDSGPRKGRAFVSENCGAVPEPLLESTLFGHKKGAFTGATSSRPGLFEVADGGTLFLDEIGEMSPPMQSKLLRVLQDGEVRAVGGETTRRVDVRIIAATHRDLEAMVKAGTFREDLFYRLNVVRIDVPALRDRTEDIPALVAHLIEKHAPERAVKITRTALDRLVAYPWPGNVRQLENEMRRVLVLGDDRIDAPDLSPEILRATQARKTGGTDLRSRLDALEAELVQDALDKTKGNQTKAAEILGISRFGLQKMIKRLGLRVVT